MALNFFRQRDIDEMDINNIPEEFINYFESLDYDRRTALIGSRQDLAKALGFVLPESEEIVSEEPRESEEKENYFEESQESEEEYDIEEDEFAQIRHNRYEGKNLIAFIKDNMPELEALALSDDEKRCRLHRTPFITSQVKYKENGAIYGIQVRICTKCNRLFIRDVMMEQHHLELIKRGIPHTFYSLELTNRYLSSQMSPHEITDQESVYIPDTWIEEKPICPIHGSRLYELPCRKSFKNRQVSFTGFYCEQCKKILVRRTMAIDLEDECARVGVVPISFLKLQETPPVKKTIRPKEIHSDYIIEDGRRSSFKRNVTSVCYQLSEDDTVVVSDSVYCALDGHDTEEVAALIWVQEKRGDRKAYLFRLGFCSHCQKYYMELGDYKILYSYGRPEVTIIHDLDDMDFQITSGEVFNLERTHLNEVEHEIDAEISYIHNRPDYMSKYATGSYDDGNLSWAKHISETKYGHLLAELNAYIPKPYSYRVDISYNGESESYYIGAKDIILDGKQQVISANSSFGHELINYQTRTIKKNGKEYGIKLTRQFDIKDAILYGYVNLRTDEDIIFKSGITDPFLIKVLNMRRRQHNLTDIFVTIQENQNRIVNTDFYKNLIVQGCAGSGKTMVLLHRLSSLNYREKGFDFSENALILTPNDQFSLHIKGLADELQIGNIQRVSVEQYYIDTLMLYSRDFKLEGKVSSEMIVRQSFVDYVYSDKFREDFYASYNFVITKRNALAETLNDLIAAMGQSERKIDFSDDTLVVRQMTIGVESLQGLVNKREKEAKEAGEELKKLTERKHFLNDAVSSSETRYSKTIDESVSRTQSKINAYLAERKQIVLSLEDQLKALQEEQTRVQNALIVFGRRGRLEEIDKGINAVEQKLNIESRRHEEEREVLFEKLEGKNKDEAVSWMRKVMLIIPDVQKEVRRCSNIKKKGQGYSDELEGIDLLIEEAEKTRNEKEQNRYSNEIKQAIDYLYAELKRYTIQGTFQLIFDQAVSSYKESHNIKNINGKYHRYDLYARLLFAMKFFNSALGSVKYMCIDEGQDLAINEYRLIYELNRRDVVFNIFGDTNQLIKEKRGVSNWAEIVNAYNAELFTLNENYRNTNQITRFCNNSFDMKMLQTGVDGAIVREIPRKDLEKELASLNVTNERIAILVPRGVQKGKYLNTSLLPSHIASIIGDKMDNGFISLMYVDEVKGIEFDKAFVVSNKMSRNEKYIAYTRALSELILVIDEHVEDYNDGSSEDLRASKKEKRMRKGAGILDYKAIDKEGKPSDEQNVEESKEINNELNMSDNESLESQADKSFLSTDALEETSEQLSDSHSHPVEIAETHEPEKPNISPALKKLKMGYLEVYVNNREGMRYFLVPYEGSLRTFTFKKAISMFIPQVNEGNEKRIPVSVVEEDRIIYITKDGFKKHESSFKHTGRIELKSYTE